MPTYEYECTKCGGVVEIFQSITEPPRKKLKATDPKPCDCNAPVHRRIGTGGGIIFKGSGFYKTDYRSESYKNAAKSETEGGAKKGEEKTSKPSTDESKATSKPKPQQKPKAEPEGVAG